MWDRNPISLKIPLPIIPMEYLLQCPSSSAETINPIQVRRITFDRGKPSLVIRSAILPFFAFTTTRHSPIPSLCKL
jgi:hypothetical protein